MDDTGSFGFVKWIIERWRSFDKQTRRLMRAILFLLLFYLVFGFIAFCFDKYHYKKPAEYLWLHNYVKPDTVVRYQDRIVYIRDTTPTVGRDRYDIKGNPIINNGKQ